MLRLYERLRRDIRLLQVVKGGGFSRKGVFSRWDSMGLVIMTSLVDSRETEKPLRIDALFIVNDNVRLLYKQPKLNEMRKGRRLAVKRRFWRTPLGKSSHKEEGIKN